MALHPKEAALLFYIRRLGQGAIELLTIKDGLPTSIVKTTQRMNLENNEQLSHVFEVEGEFFPLGKG